MKKILVFVTVLMSMLLFKNSVYAYEEYTVGDLIEYRDEYYFVIADSDEKQNYVTLLKYAPLTKVEINRYNNSLSPSDEGAVLFSRNEIIKLLNKWSKDFSDDLIEVNGYKVRLINNDDLMDNFKYDYEQYKVDSYNYSYKYTKTDETPEFHGIYNYWTMISKGDNDNSVYYVSKNLGIGETWSFEAKKYLIRPVINLNKSFITSCKRKYRLDVETKYSKLHKGNVYGIRNTYFTIVEDSDETQPYVVLFKSDTLTKEEINRYSNGEYNDVFVPYFISEECNRDNTNGCTNNYDNSIVKKIVDNWANDLFNEDELIEID